jgi:hypothetical protein
MKTLTQCLALIICLHGFSVQAADEIETEVFALEWDHWLWMKRIADQDPDWRPNDFDPANQKIRMFERKSAKEIYEACGVNVVGEESFIYGPTTTQMIVQLGKENLRRVRRIHKTIRDWKSGMTGEWHLDWSPRQERNAETQTGRGFKTEVQRQ